MTNVLGKKSNVYFGYYTRLCFNIIAYLVLFVVAVLCFIFSFEFSDVQVVKYQEASNLNYWVYVHENEFYENNYLEKDMVYIANLIDKIVIDFDYNFAIDSKESLDLIYDIKADLLITDSSDKVYYKKSYDLLDDKKQSIVDANMSNVNEQVIINYELYNNLANKFKTAYGVEAKSYLDVYMTVNKSSNEDSNFTLNDNNSMNVRIPLSQHSIDIKLDYLDIHNSDIIVKDRLFNFSSIFMLIISIISFILSIYMLVLFVKKILLLRGKKSIFDKVVSKILKEYDFYIAETSTLISFEGKEIVKVDKFTELLDIHDNLRQPIMYYLVNKHQKCYFYINHKYVVYLVVIKAVDLENKNTVETLEERKRRLLKGNSFVNNKQTLTNNNVNSNSFVNSDKSVVNNLTSDNVAVNSNISNNDNVVTSVSGDTGIYNFDMLKNDTVSNTVSGDTGIYNFGMLTPSVINQNNDANNVSPTQLEDVVIKKVDLSDINNNVEVSNVNNQLADFMDMPVLKDKDVFKEDVSN